MARISDYPLGNPTLAADIPYMEGLVTQRATPRAILDGGGVYAHMYYDDPVGTGAIAIAQFPLSTPLNIFSAGSQRGLQTVLGGAVDHILIPAGFGGRYKISLHASLDFSGADTFAVGLYVNGVECMLGCKGRDTFAASSTGINIAASVITPTLADLDEISMQMYRLGAVARNAEFYVAGVSVVRVGA